MLEDRTISILTNNLETVLAEKFETIITRGVTNTRLRDFYDVYILTQTQIYDASTFKAALERTAEMRHITQWQLASKIRLLSS
jgi:predicted nucleotidyltransferase component of viral defense system